MATSSGKSHALVVVLGDLGHSPRMQNHVRELLDAAFTVDFIGYTESDLPNDMKSTNLRTISLPNCRLEWNFMSPIILRLLNMILKLIVQTAVLCWIGIFRTGRPSIIIVQSPPVLPTLSVCYLLAKIRRAKLIVDWHNIGYTILAQTVKIPVLIATAKAVELLMTKAANINFVVSQAQRQWMQMNAGIMAITLYDRPIPSRFALLSQGERREFRQVIRGRLGWDPRDDIPIVVSSTSWTHDEDFGILVEALQQVDQRIQLLVTGKGPLKTHFEEKVLELGLTNVQFATLWLSFEDYAKLLGSADLGICLHSSSSGVDLPMKAIDMIASGLPVAAVEFPAITELLEDGHSGFLFKNAEALATVINDAASNPANLKRIQIPKLETWHDQWHRIVLPLLPLAKSA